MSRYDGKLTAAGGSPIDAADLLAALGSQSRLTPHERRDAIARYLSAGEGWREACRLLGGAFAPDQAAEGETEPPGLNGGKDR